MRAYIGRYVNDLMVVKVRFGHGPVVTRRKGKNSRIAMLGASLLTLVAISCASLGLWRVGTDLDWAGDFVFQSGFLSHWQVWSAPRSACNTQACGGPLCQDPAQTRSRDRACSGNDGF